MFDETTRAIKLGEALGWDTRYSRWIAEHDKRPILARFWASITYWSIPYYVVFLVSLFLFLSGSIRVHEALFWLIMPVAFYASGTRHMVTKDTSAALTGIVQDLDNLERRIEKLEASVERSILDR